VRELLDDVWFTRDLPVLRAVARLVDGPGHGGNPYLGQVVPASGLPKAEVTAAARALVSTGYVEALTNYAGEIVRFTGISAEAPGWPGSGRHRRGSGTGCSSSWSSGRPTRRRTSSVAGGGRSPTRRLRWGPATARC
jgi:hypothetical protein